MAKAKSTTPTNLIQLPGTKLVPTTAPKKIRSVMDTLIITPEAVERWKKPPFQRTFKLSKKVNELVDELKIQSATEKTVVLPGIITIGIMVGEKYLLDGQHRVEAFKMAGLTEGLVDVRICHFDSMADMGDEFVKLNSSLVRMNPDDILRGLEGSIEALKQVRKRCSFIGYGYLRANPEYGPIVSMSTACRAWLGSANETPAFTGAVADAARHMTNEEAKAMADFLETCFEAWGRDLSCARLWTTLNLTITAWLWRRTVIAQYSARSTRLTREQFRKCLMALSTDDRYSDWLMGRRLGDRDRAPAYARVKDAFTKRLEVEGFTPAIPGGKKAMFPQPAWATTTSTGSLSRGGK